MPRVGAMATHHRNACLVAGRLPITRVTAVRTDRMCEGLSEMSLHVRPVVGAEGTIYVAGDADGVIVTLHRT